MSDNKNLDLWNRVKQPPASVLKPISGGRLSGKTDISPAWRYQTMTEQFGVCGIGWKYTIDELWTVPGDAGEHFAFARVSLYTRNGKDWSDPIPGIGGSMLVEKERAGLHNNDEGYKMAVTDALSVACKMLGLASDVYMGLWDGSKYRTTPPTGASEASKGSKAAPTASSASKPAGSAPLSEKPAKEPWSDDKRAKAGLLISKYINELSAALVKSGITEVPWKAWLKAVYGYPTIYAIKVEAYAGILKVVKGTPEVIKNFGSDGAPQDADVPISEQPLPF